jgi:Zn finger protein HypA/HybF involved in hydrogenase expression
VHEFSIAEHLLGQVRDHLPAGGRLVSLSLRAGAAQAIDPEALALAWHALTEDQPERGAALHLESLPWQHACARRGRSWASRDALDACADCGAPSTPRGDFELTLMALEVETAEPALEPASPGLSLH